MATIFSIEFLGTLSPYPIVSIVTIAKYIDSKYCNYHVYPFNSLFKIQELD